jgi:hypothetical protein
LRPVQVVDLTVALDDGQFYLSSPTQAPGHDGEDLLTLVDEAVLGRGVAGAEGEDLVVVISPHQNNFDMRLRIEVWATEPPADLDEWQEAFVAGLVIGSAGLVYASPTMEERTVPVAPGRYAVRIMGRGFVHRGWPGSTTPGDEWRLQLWPAPSSIRPRRLRAWTDPALAMEGSGRPGDLDDLRAPDTIGRPDDRSS